MSQVRFWFLLVMSCCADNAWGGTDVTNIVHEYDQGSTRLTLELNGPFRYKTFSLKNPERLVIDFLDTNLETRLPGIDSTGSIISAIRSGQRSNGSLRLVLDLSSPATSNIFMGGIGDAEAHSLAIYLHLEPYVIVIDPGHGGKDPGAIGYGGVTEKDIVLDVSNRVARLINQQPGMRSILTRESDYYPSLRNRVTTARQAQAKIFLSIHADSFERKSVRGISVYALSEGGASSEMAAYLAQRENSADLAGGVSLSGQDEFIAEVMLDMQLDWKIQESRLLGKEMLIQLGRVAKLHNKNVAHAGFVVLKAPAIPSVLIETGYITNTIDARQLQRSSYRQRLSAAIFRGIFSYCLKRPGCPLPSMMETIYIVKPGDSLSKIANRFESDVSTIKRWNGLENSIIVPKQQLVIPRKIH
jgi:N-acetylmuramoyl-L-alanine amidase